MAFKKLTKGLKLFRTGELYIFICPERLCVINAEINDIVICDPKDNDRFFDMFDEDKAVEIDMREFTEKLPRTFKANLIALELIHYVEKATKEYEEINNLNGILASLEVKKIKFNYNEN